MTKTGVSSLEKGSSMQMGNRKTYIAGAVERPVVVDDFIRNFLTKCGMTKSMNIFQ